MIKPDKKYLITGGSGFLGQALVKRLFEKGIKNLVVVARNEGQLVSLKEQYPSIEIITGDISNKFIAEKACLGVDGIFHLAAFKHVGLAETNVEQCILSNVVGTMNLLEQTLTCIPDFIIGISTDKAAQVKGVYGATKLLQERLFSEYEVINRATQYRTVRYGNVLYSTGSVLCKWKEKMARGERITLTDEHATRFYWTVEQAVDLIFACLENAADSKPFYTAMKAIRMGDLLHAMVKKYNDGRMPDLDVIGLQRGENMHEIIADNGQDSSIAPKHTIAEIMQMI
jgi:UDP-N-acetylglucosamine 4,6-dehydratase/5-epimerase